MYIRFYKTIALILLCITCFILIASLKLYFIDIKLLKNHCTALLQNKLLIIQHEPTINFGKYLIIEAHNVSMLDDQHHMISTVKNIRYSITWWWLLLGKYDTSIITLDNISITPKLLISTMGLWRSSIRKYFKLLSAQHINIIDNNGVILFADTSFVMHNDKLPAIEIGYLYQLRHYLCTIDQFTTVINQDSSSSLQFSIHQPALESITATIILPNANPNLIDSLQLTSHYYSLKLTDIHLGDNATIATVNIHGQIELIGQNIRFMGIEQLYIDSLSLKKRMKDSNISLYLNKLHINNKLQHNLTITGNLIGNFKGKYNNNIAVKNLYITLQSQQDLVEPTLLYAIHLFNDHYADWQFFTKDNIMMQLYATQFRLKNNIFSDISITARSISQMIILHKLFAHIYGGKIAFDGKLTFVGQLYNIMVHGIGQHLALQQVLQTLFNVEAINGTADFATNLSIKQTNWHDMLAKLNGYLLLSVYNGALHGIDLSIFDNDFSLKSPITFFQKLHTKLNFNHGISYDSPLSFKSADVLGLGNGKIDIVHQLIAYQLFLSSRLLKHKQENTVSIPIAISNDLFHPDVYISNMTVIPQQLRHDHRIKRRQLSSH